MLWADIPEPILFASTAAALLTVAAGLHLPPAPVHAAPPVEALATPDEPRALPVWLRPVQRPAPAQEMQLVLPPVANPPAKSQPSSNPARATRRGRPPLPRPVEAYGTGRAAEAVRWALAQRGKPYIWASEGPRGFDCSGLVVASFRQIGVALPHQTGALARRGRAVARGQLQPGDLVFTSRSHVGLYVGGNQMVHAPKRGDVVRVARIHSFAFARRVVG